MGLRCGETLLFFYPFLGPSPPGPLQMRRQGAFSGGKTESLCQLCVVSAAACLPGARVQPGAHGSHS